MSENKINSLVKYDTPVLVTTKKSDKTDKVPQLSLKDGIPTDISETSSTSAPGLSGPLPRGGPLGTTPAPSLQLPPLHELRKKETEEILNLILPPREWEEEGQLWVQAVSTTPATSVDVQQLQEELDLRLQEQSAFETGICPVRRELYTQCFDELIRQVTINCAERGLLLYRVRDEIRETLDAYQRLYTSSCAYGVRKALMAEEHKVKVGARCEELRAQVRELQHLATSLRQEIEQVEKEAQQARQAEADKHEETKRVHQARIEILKKKLESIIKQATQPKK
ncbi:33 kDa inner dynein arm light chain, axonemal-like isoform X2 [Portunus trituberculatus]|uniref:33 kDa inner dynein arm light chain, axonemal-like isoform X2 n=1 Tax=Portunus trituberculatus TaxID=210409 RepID=UPI001E1CBE37|nr:33 kDa inner dynein arm light chain, axonemal-like isoform X2 [Portunus trituberculatus]